MASETAGAGAAVAGEAGGGGAGTASELRVKRFVLIRVKRSGPMTEGTVGICVSLEFGADGEISWGSWKIA